MKLAVIGANAPLLPFYRQAASLGYEIYGFAWEQGAVCRQYCTKFYPISFTDKEAILDICRKEKIDGITSFSLESALPTVMYVAVRMGLVGNSEECMSLTKDKFSMRRRFMECGVPVPGFCHVSDISELENVDMKFPLIVKPTDSGGSRGVYKVNERSSLSAAFERAVSFSPTKTAMIEEYVGGREFSVEYISCAGRHYFVQITDKVTSGAPYFVELAHHQPADLTLHQQDSIKQVVERALSALKITDSPSHTELKMEEDGSLKIIEIGARMGGDYITSDLVRLSTGYDFVKGNIELVTGHFNEPVFKDRKYSGVYFLCSQTQEKVLPYIENASKYSWIVDSCIDGETMFASNNGERAGYLIYQSEHKIVL